MQCKYTCDNFSGGSIPDIELQEYIHEEYWIARYYLT